MIELLDSPLSIARCIDAVRVPGAGGIATFIGCVRDTSEGKRIDHLEYEAYESMVMDKLAQVVSEASGRWPILAIAIQHRIGSLAIGDDAVAIAVATPHRAEAFESCRYVIDRLKEIVPIWKKEFSEDGAVWVGGPAIENPQPNLGPAPD
ncbi:MAG: molybdenum cofactor biosynthesis protein MoaE [Chloroflexota bacterium]